MTKGRFSVLAYPSWYCYYYFEGTRYHHEQATQLCCDQYNTAGVQYSGSSSIYVRAVFIYFTMFSVYKLSTCLVVQ